jgi:hypothetical protein
MKKLIVFLIFTSLLSVGISNAQTAQKNGNQTTINRQCQWVDKNNDGICDNYQNLKTNRKGSNFVDKNKDGICDNIQKIKSNANCPNFVDQNKDGICDNFQNNAKNKMCCGKGIQCRKGNGNGWRNR